MAIAMTFHKRRWPRFSLGTIFCVITAVAVFLALQKVTSKTRFRLGIIEVAIFALALGVWLWNRRLPRELDPGPPAAHG